MMHTIKSLLCVQRCHVHIATKILQLALTETWRENKRSASLNPTEDNLTTVSNCICLRYNVQKVLQKMTHGDTAIIINIT